MKEESRKKEKEDFNILSSVSSYSYLKASTGFLVAAFQLCMLTVKSATPSAINPARANTYLLSSVLCANKRND